MERTSDVSVFSTKKITPSGYEAYWNSRQICTENKYFPSTNESINILKEHKGLIHCYVVKEKMSNMVYSMSWHYPTPPLGLAPMVSS